MRFSMCAHADRCGEGRASQGRHRFLFYSWLAKKASSRTPCWNSAIRPMKHIVELCGRVPGVPPFAAYAFVYNHARLRGTSSSVKLFLNFFTTSVGVGSLAANARCRRYSFDLRRGLFKHALQPRLLRWGRISRRTWISVSDRPHISFRSQPSSTASSQTAPSRSEWLTMYRCPSSSRQSKV